MKVSVIVTSYNNEKYIVECIESILAQTYDDIELIIVDDGSKDRTPEVLRRLQISHPEIHLIFKENGGVSTARNAGLDVATGEFVMFVDGDDRIKNNEVEVLVSFAGRHPKIDLVCNCCDAFDDQMTVEDHFFTSDFSALNMEEKEPLYLQLFDVDFGQPKGQTVFTGIGVPWGKLYRRKFLETHHLRFNTKLRRMQDNTFNMWCFSYARGVAYLDVPLYEYRTGHIANYISARSHISNENIYEIIRERMKFLRMFNIPKKNRLYGAAMREVRQWYRYSVKTCILDENDEQTAYEKAKELGKLPYYRAYAGSFIRAVINNPVGFRLCWQIIRKKQ